MMLKDKLNTILNSKAFYVCFSIIMSITLWAYVAYVDNPDVPVTVNNVKIEFSGSEALVDSNLVLTSIDTDSLTIRFSGKRNDVTKLDASNVTVKVDLTEILKLGVAGVYRLSYEINYPTDVDTSSITVTSASADYITANVEKMISKPIQVKYNYDGGVMEGYKAEPVELSPETITVSGPESIVSDISYALVTLLRENIYRTVEEDLPFTLHTDDGTVVDHSDQLIFNTETIHLKLPVVMLKEVSLTVNIAYGAGAVKENTVVRVFPETILLAGDPEILNDLNQINLGTIDVTDFPTTFTDSFRISIPNDVENLTGESEAVVMVNITGLDTKKLSATNIQYKNATEGYNVEVITQSLDITIRGDEELLEQVTSENIRIVADLSELGKTTGTFTLVAKVYIDGFTEVGPIGDYLVTITVTRAE